MLSPNLLSDHTGPEVAHLLTSLNVKARLVNFKAFFCALRKEFFHELNGYLLVCLESQNQVGHRLIHIVFVAFEVVVMLTNAEQADFINAVHLLVGDILKVFDNIGVGTQKGVELFLPVQYHFEMDALFERALVFTAKLLHDLSLAQLDQLIKEVS